MSPSVGSSSAQRRTNRSAMPNTGLGPSLTSTSLPAVTADPHASSEGSGQGWLELFADLTVVVEDQEPVKGTGEPAVVGDGQDRALEFGESFFQRLRADQVQVVGWLIQQQQGRPTQLQQQDLQAGLLAA
jgi:hypothetical protein